MVASWWQLAGLEVTRKVVEEGEVANDMWGLHYFFFLTRIPCQLKQTYLHTTIGPDLDCFAEKRGEDFW